MDLAHNWITQNYGEEAAEILCVTNPRATVEGEPLERFVTDRPPAARKWYQLWR